jgi:hypothetical protein
MEKHNIIIFAVNQHVIDYFLFPWLSQKESKNYKLYIVTNEFEYLNISQKLKGRDYELIDYFGPRFNYYDKFIIGTGIINKIKQPSFIWDVDELSVFHQSVHLYDTSIDVVQAGRRYYKDATLGDERNADGFLLTLLETWVLTQRQLLLYRKINYGFLTSIIHSFNTFCKNVNTNNTLTKVSTTVSGM